MTLKRRCNQLEMYKCLEISFVFKVTGFRASQHQLLFSFLSTDKGMAGWFSSPHTWRQVRTISTWDKRCLGPVVFLSFWPCCAPRHVFMAPDVWHKWVSGESHQSQAVWAFGSLGLRSLDTDHGFDRSCQSFWGQCCFCPVPLRRKDKVWIWICNFHVFV